MIDKEVVYAEGRLPIEALEYRKHRQSFGAQVPTRCCVCNTVIVAHPPVAWAHARIRDGQAVELFSCIPCRDEVP